MKRLIYFLLAGCLVAVASLLTTACRKETANPLLEEGVSWELASMRLSCIDSLQYKLHFTIPEKVSEALPAQEEICFHYKQPQKPMPYFVLDFKESPDKIKSFRLNGKKTTYTFDKEHIFVPAKRLRKGTNRIEIAFVAGEQSLNRRESFLYTLLVPDRARTLFPCFDQPNLKASYQLSLTVPDGWVAVGNSPLAEGSNAARDTMGARDTSAHTYSFSPTEPLSTYLFAFVAGAFQKESLDGISLYHRETDPQKVAQIPIVLAQINECIAWLESYTGIRYPFAKYDCIIIPGFQYGGMEHTGATLYNDNLIFLNEGSGIQSQIARFKLLAHETAHMWFGDYVTMEWFNDVWTKEVFANYFAALMVADKYPNVDQGFAFLDYADAAYAVDRTPGSNAIKQPLANLKDAGLIYGNIIYNKAPIVMDMLAQRMGPEAFQTGIRTYLSQYAYGNATWEDLAAILNDQWSYTWVHEKGMPEYRMEKGTPVCRDPLGRGLQWEQPVSVTSFSEGARTYQIPNLDGKSYGYFVLDSLSSAFLMDAVCDKKPTIQFNALQKIASLNILNENAIHKTISIDTYQDFCVSVLESLRDQSSQESALLFGRTLSYLRSTSRLIQAPLPESILNRIAELVYTSTLVSNKKGALTCIINENRGTGQDSLGNVLANALRHPEDAFSFPLSEADLTTLAFELAIRRPEEAAELLATQRARISNPDRLERFDFIAQAVQPDASARRAFFNALLQEENRRVEPWARTALQYLCHPLYAAEALSYIQPGLEVLEEIQRTGDIFFPAQWCSALLGTQQSPRAHQEVNDFLHAHPNLNPLLVTKITSCYLY